MFHITNLLFNLILVDLNGIHEGLFDTDKNQCAEKDNNQHKLKAVEKVEWVKRTGTNLTKAEDFGEVFDLNDSCHKLISFHMFCIILP